LLSKLQIGLNYLFLHRHIKAGDIQRISDENTLLFNSLRAQFNDAICATPSASQAAPIMIDVGKIKNEIERLSKYYQLLIENLHSFETEIEKVQQGGGADKVRIFIGEIKSRLNQILAHKNSLDNFEDTAYNANEELASPRHRAVLAVLENLQSNQRSTTDSIKAKIEAMKPAVINPDQLAQERSARIFNSEKAELLLKINNYLRSDSSNMGEKSKISSDYLKELRSKNDEVKVFKDPVMQTSVAKAGLFSSTNDSDNIKGDLSIAGGGYQKSYSHA
jgi:hypothetical protein